MRPITRQKIARQKLLASGMSGCTAQSEAAAESMPNNTIIRIITAAAACAVACSPPTECAAVWYITPIYNSYAVPPPHARTPAPPAPPLSATRIAWDSENKFLGFVAAAACGGGSCEVLVRTAFAGRCCNHALCSGDAAQMMRPRAAAPRSRPLSTVHHTRQRKSKKVRRRRRRRSFCMGGVPICPKY